MSVPSQPQAAEYHWMITYLVPKVGGFDFRQKSGVCQPDGRTRSVMFEVLAQRIMDEDGLTVEAFSTVFFGLEPNRLDGQEPEPTPASVHALQERADRERRDFAWLHQCGHLNHGYWDDRSVCGGCRFSVEKADEVDGHYRLVPVEGLSEEGQT